MKETTKPEPAPEIVDLHRLIRCLEAVEGGEWHHPGGKLCIKRGIWQEHTKAAYIHACDPGRAREVAARILTTFISKLDQVNVKANVRWLARCWHEGFEGATSHAEVGDYSQRVENLYKDKEFAP